VLGKRFRAKKLLPDLAIIKSAWNNINQVKAGAFLKLPTEEIKNR
jgi:hypothetical protein